MLFHYRLLELEPDVTWERRQLVNDRCAERPPDFRRCQCLPNIFGIKNQFDTVAAVGFLAVSADEHAKRYLSVKLRRNRHGTVYDARDLRKCRHDCARLRFEHLGCDLSRRCSTNVVQQLNVTRRLYIADRITMRIAGHWQEAVTECPTYPPTASAWHTSALDVANACS